MRLAHTLEIPWKYWKMIMLNIKIVWGINTLIGYTISIVQTPIVSAKFSFHGMINIKCIHYED
jgi:hypothetical protein